MRSQKLKGQRDKKRLYATRSLPEGGKGCCFTVDYGQMTAKVSGRSFWVAGGGAVG